MTKQKSAELVASEMASLGDESQHVHEAKAATANFLMQKHGPVLDGPALVDVLHYPTLTALERSLQRGHLKIKILNLPGRRGIFVHAYELARYLSMQMAGSDSGQDGSQPEGQEHPPVEKGARARQKI